jgi:hypothetical protein
MSVTECPTHGRLSVTECPTHGVRYAAVSTTVPLCHTLTPSCLARANG